MNLTAVLLHGWTLTPAVVKQRWTLLYCILKYRNKFHCHHKNFTPGIYTRGNKNPGSLRDEIPSEVQQPSAGRGSPRSCSSLQTLFTDFDCRNDQKLKILHNSLTDSWPVSVHGRGPKRHFGGLAPSPWLATPVTIIYDPVIPSAFSCIIH